MPTESEKGRSTASEATAPAVFPSAADATSRALITVAALAEIPEEDIWLAKQKSKRTRRAYKLDVQNFMRTLNIHSYDELRQVDHRAVIAWERIMREIDKAAPSTIRRRLAALSSLFKHLVRHDHAEKNPVGEVERPAINREEGTTLAFSKGQARKLLDTPADDSIEGLRDRAILSVGLQVGLRRAEIASLKVGDLHQNRGFDSLRVVRKGGFGTKRLPSIHRRRKGLERTLRKWDTPPILTGRCSAHFAEIAKVR